MMICGRLLSGHIGFQTHFSLCYIQIQIHVQIQIQIQSVHSTPMHILQMLYPGYIWIALLLEVATIQIFNGSAPNPLYGKCVKEGDEEN